MEGQRGTREGERRNEQANTREIENNQAPCGNVCVPWARARGQEGKREAERGRWEAGGAQIVCRRREEHRVYTRQENAGEIGEKEEGNV